MTAPAWRSVGAPPDLLAYAQAHSSPSDDPIATRLAEATVEAYGGLATMNIGQDQGRLMELLVQLSGAHLVVEVGTFTGMSALWLARGLRGDGRLVCFDIKAEYPEVGKPFWAEAGVAERIEVRIGAAADRLPELAGEGPVDLAFIDADKGGYATYLEVLLPLMADDGVILVDNVLWGGAVIDETDQDPDTVAIRDFNRMVAQRSDCDVVVLPIGDGVSIVRPRR